MWYIGHVIMLVRFKEEVDNSIPLYENLFLIEAESFATAKVEAVRLGKLGKK